MTLFLEPSGGSKSLLARALAAEYGTTALTIMGDITRRGISIVGIMPVAPKMFDGGGHNGPRQGRGRQGHAAVIASPASGEQDGRGRGNTTVTGCTITVTLAANISVTDSNITGHRRRAGK